MNIAIYGLGLIGGSIGRAAIKRTNHKIYGFDISEETMVKAKLLQAISCELKPGDLGKIDLVILSLYPSAAIEVMHKILPSLHDGAIIIDCCGTKRKIVKAMQQSKQEYPKINFVGIHPMAGREFSGISHALYNLFDNCYTILTPVQSDMQTMTTIKQFFIDLGCAGIEVASAEKHDKMISYTSQLAHVLSSSYIKNPLSNCYTGFSAGSFRDMTRVAKLNPQMWTELCLENKDNLVEQIDDLQKHLSEFRNAIANGDEKLLYDLFKAGAEMKANAEELMKERKKNDRN